MLGNAYPDILLLPPLARLLNVDLNTLLSFQETLTQTEVEWLLERKLGEAAMEIQSALYALIDISMEEGKSDEAEYFAEIAEKTAKVYDLWEHTAWIAKFQLAAAKRDADQCIEALKGMLHAMRIPWNMSASPLYRHVAPEAGSYVLPQKTVSGLLTEIKNDANMDFLKSSKAFHELMALYS